MQFGQIGVDQSWSSVFLLLRLASLDWRSAQRQPV